MSLSGEHRFTGAAFSGLETKKSKVTDSIKPRGTPAEKVSLKHEKRTKTGMFHCERASELNTADEELPGEKQDCPGDAKEGTFWVTQRFLKKSGKISQMWCKNRGEEDV